MAMHTGRWSIPIVPDKTNSAGIVARMLFAWTVFEKNSPRIDTGEALAFMKWIGWPNADAHRRVLNTFKTPEYLPEIGSVLILTPRSRAGEFTIKGITGFGLRGISWQDAADAWALLKEHKSITIPRKGDWQHVAAPFGWLRWHDVAECYSHADRLDYWIVPGAESEGPSYLTVGEMHMKHIFPEPITRGVRRYPNRLRELPTPEWSPRYGLSED